MKILVLGAGVVGVSTAWYLAQAGHEVTVIEREPAPARETTFANGGQVSVSHELWANPQAPLQVLKWLRREDAPLLFRLRADPAQWRWGLQFLLECLPGRTRFNTIQNIGIALHSRNALQQLRRDTGIEYDHLERGILHFYADAKAYEHAIHTARLMSEFGCERILKTPDEIVAIEPALAHAKSKIVGGDYSPSDESGDARKFTEKLAAMCVQAGVEFSYNTKVERIGGSGDRIEGVQVSHAQYGSRALQSDAYVVALGSYSPLMLRPLGLRPLIYPLKGYSITLPLASEGVAPHVSLTDDHHKIVFSRLGDRLRVAGTAELNGYNTELNPVRLDALVTRTRELFPLAGDFSCVERWAGLRPSTPSNLPYIGKTRYRNLFLNTGHGTLGWTMGPGSGQVLADIISGRKPEIDVSAYQL